MLLLLFCLGIGSAVLGKREVQCRCFGADGGVLGVRHLVRNSALIAVAGCGYLALPAHLEGTLAPLTIIVAPLVVVVGAHLLFTAGLDVRVKELQGRPAHRRENLPASGTVVQGFSAVGTGGEVLTEEDLREPAGIGFFSVGCGPCRVLSDRLVEGPPPGRFVSFVDVDPAQSDDTARLDHLGWRRPARAGPRGAARADRRGVPVVHGLRPHRRREHRHRAGPRPRRPGPPHLSRDRRPRRRRRGRPARRLRHAPLAHPLGRRAGRRRAVRRQWKRVALARCLMRDDAGLLVLDEPTSGLDAVGERRVHETLRRRAAGRTRLLVSRRLSALRGADLIVTLSGGRIAERGRHDELVDAGGECARLFRLQAGGYQDGRVRWWRGGPG